MASENNNNHESTSSDSSYGGSTYRLSYDHAENKKNRVKKTGIKMIAVIVLSVILLFVFAFFALKHYEDAIKKLYASEVADNDGKASADFQSSADVIIN